MDMLPIDAEYKFVVEGTQSKIMYHGLFKKDLLFNTYDRSCAAIDFCTIITCSICIGSTLLVYHTGN